MGCYLVNDMPPTKIMLIRHPLAPYTPCPHLKNYHFFQFWKGLKSNKNKFHEILFDLDWEKFLDWNENSLKKFWMEKNSEV